MVCWVCLIGCGYVGYSVVSGSVGVVFWVVVFICLDLCLGSLIVLVLVYLWWAYYWICDIGGYCCV